MNTATLTKKVIHQKSIALLLLSCAFGLVFFYMYFVSVAIVEVVVRTEISHDINMLSSEISELESKYIKAQHKVTGDVASLQGYKKSSAKVFIERGGDSLVLGDRSLR